MEKETCCDIECQACGEPATGKVYVCSEACASRLAQPMELSRGPRGHRGGHRRGPRLFGGGGRHVFRRAFAPLFRPYYARHYRAYLADPLWRRYAWYAYYRNFPPYSPFWYLVSVYPPGSPFWATFGYYPPDDPYWLQYQGAVAPPPYGPPPYGSPVTTPTEPPMDFASHVCGGGGVGDAATFVISSPLHGPDTWVLSEGPQGISYRGRALAKMPPSLWDALLTAAEHSGAQDWTPSGQQQPATDGRQYRMRLASGAEYELRAQSETRTLLNAVLGASMRQRVKGTDVLFNRIVQQRDGEGRERGTLLMASGHAYRYKVAHCDATLEEKLRGARRITGQRMSAERVQQLVALATHLKHASYAVASGSATTDSATTTMLVSYASKSPVLVWAKGRLQTHYETEEDARLSARFNHLYKKLI
jgi:hypothetical protein